MKWKATSSNKITYTNGNHTTTLYSDGTKVKETIDPNADHFTYDFPESFDLKITDWCDGKCPQCHENSTMKGKHANLEKIYPMIDTMTPGTEIAIGGGNALAHPALLKFILRLSDRGIIPNITINQKHLKNFFNSYYYRENYYRLLKGIGVSLTDSSNEKDMGLLNKLCLMSNNIVIHTIAGVLTPRDYPVLYGRKVLILGFKDLRRGHDYLSEHSEEVKKNIERLKNDLPMLAKKCKAISFDCLGLEQIQPKEIFGMSDEEFNKIYQGHDYDMFDKDGKLTVSTMFIDAVNMTVSRSSTSAMDKRYKFTGKEDVRELLAKSCEGY